MIITKVLPKSAAGNDPNDHRDDPDYLGHAEQPDPIDVATVVDAEAEQIGSATKERQSKARFSFATVGELLAKPDPVWLVDELIEETGIGVLYAPSGGGKTFVTLDLCCSIVRGLPWFGLDVRPGAVAYVATEGNLAVRLRAYLKHHDVSATALDELRVLSSSVNLLDGNADVATLVAALVALKAELGSLSLVVVDTLNRAMPGGNENASEDMGSMVLAASTIREALGCFVLYVHHCGKDESKGSRGHSSLKAAADCEISIEQQGAMRIIQAAKVRDAEERPIGAFTLAQVDLGARSSCAIVPEDAPSKRPKADRLTPKQRIAVDALHWLLDAKDKRRVASAAEIEGGAKIDQYIALHEDWRQACYFRAISDGAQNAKRMAFNRASLELQAAHRVQVGGEFVWLSGQ